MGIKSIRFKFILIIAILMAMMMALQLYFTSQTRRDVLGELDRFSRTVNMATDQFVFEQIQSAGDSGQKARSLKNIRKWTWASDDSLGHEEIETDLNIDDSLVATLKPLIKNSRHSVTRMSIKMDSLQRTIIKLKSKVFTPSVTKLKKNSRQLAKVLEQLERFKKKNLHDVNEQIEFVMPALTNKSPGIVHFSYNTSSLQSALIDIRNRNILISIALFLLALGVIMLIANRFLRPIQTLQKAFDRVVDGDLDATVSVDRTDEIGMLTNAFNHMVSELRKNREKETSVRRKERLASLGQLAAGVAHEIKNPLNAINLTIQHLRDKFIDSKNTAVRGHMDVVQSEIRRLDKIVNNFLSYVRNEKLERKMTDMKAFVLEIIQLYQRELTAHRVKFELDAPELCRLDIDPERFKTVFMNLIINALQAMPNGGVLKISILANAKRIIIQDSGKGIPEKSVEHIFDLFYTTKGSGTGLGLPTAYKIVKAHGGDISIESTEQTGTKVIIDLG